MYVRQVLNVNVPDGAPTAIIAADVDRPITVFLAEDNLVFSARLGSALKAAGFAVEVWNGRLPDEIECDVMVLNLGARGFDVQEAAGRTRKAGAKLIGHAGGRETELISLGKRIGCDRILSNSQAMSDIVGTVRALCES